jgi:hypothetical protein
MSYLGAKPGSHGRIESSQTKDSIVATANQQVFTTVGYTPSTLQVYLNGVLLLPSDYIAANGTTITLNVPAVIGDELSYVSAAAFTPVSNANPTHQFFSGTGALTDFTLTPPLLTPNSLLVFVGGVAQRAGYDFTASGATLSFSTAPVLGTNNIVAFQVGYSSSDIGTPSNGTVTSAKIDTPIFENSTTITTNYSLAASKNGFSVGPIAVSSGGSVTIPTGQRWLVS